MTCHSLAQQTLLLSLCCRLKFGLYVGSKESLTVDVQEFVVSRHTANICSSTDRTLNLSLHGDSKNELEAETLVESVEVDDSEVDSEHPLKRSHYALVDTGFDRRI